jgi:hypothetical protein
MLGLFKEMILRAQPFPGAAVIGADGKPQPEKSCNRGSVR